MRYRKWFSCPGPQGQVTNVLKITKSVRGIWFVKSNAPSLKSSMKIKIYEGDPKSNVKQTMHKLPIPCTYMANVTIVNSLNLTSSLVCLK
jgi:hypothetical protein